MRGLVNLASKVYFAGCIFMGLLEEAKDVASWSGRGRGDNEFSSKTEGFLLGGLESN